MDALLKRRIMMQGGGVPPPLPDGPVDYIETDGIAYINTGILGNAPIAIELKMTPVAVSSNSYMIGTRSTSGSTRFVPVCFWSNPAKYVGFGYAGKTNNGVDVSYSINNSKPVIIHSELANGRQYIGVKEENDANFRGVSASTGSSLSTNYALTLFAYNTYDGIVSNMPDATKLNYCKIYSDISYTTLVFDGIAYRYNGEYGLWDNISDSFFGNAASSGAFRGA